ncbi:MAG: hypothetical protein KY476_07160 [Planctomycetes bacterium]|nr:hypothetical protein [Planctomycetota bacterium]
MSDGSRTRRFLGVTVLGDFILSEGPRAVLENLRRIGATAVATNPTVTAPAEEGCGSFQPPDDAGTSPRVFDRPLFGRRSLWVRSGPSYVPDVDLYRDSPYAPRQPNELTERHGTVIGEFIRAAADAGLKVYLQVGAVQPAGLRDEDRPRLPTGELPQGRMADTGCLASPAIRAYNRAYVRDLLQAYPQVNGFRPDWPEYPCYTLDEAFQGFGPHVAAWCRQNDALGGMSYEALCGCIARVRERLTGGLSAEDLADVAAPGRGLWSLLERIGDAAWEPVRTWLRLKAQLSLAVLGDWRRAIDEVRTGVELSANAFMPPYSRVTGFDFHGAAGVCDSINPKLYTMHWALMVTFWGRALLEHNPGLDERLIVRSLVHLMDLADAEQRESALPEKGDTPLSGQEGDGPLFRMPGETLADYRYPEPHEPHPIPDRPQRRKIDQVLRSVAGQAAVFPLVHGYGPVEDFTRRLRLVAESPADGVWINRYGYLSDEKLERIAEVWK